MSQAETRHTEYDNRMRTLRQRADVLMPLRTAMWLGEPGRPALDPQDLMLYLMEQGFDDYMLLGAVTRARTLYEGAHSDSLGVTEASIGSVWGSGTSPAWAGFLSSDGSDYYIPCDAIGLDPPVAVRLSLERTRVVQLDPVSPSGS